MQVKILADSIQSLGVRATTFLLTYPRFIHSEMLTHRVFSRNSSSSRAIPSMKVIKDVYNTPAVPVRFGRAKKGMQDDGPLSNTSSFWAKHLWLKARYPAIVATYLLNKLGVHKQVANRLLEPWVNITVVLTGTDFTNFYKLRTHKDAQPEIQQLACMMQDLHNKHIPAVLDDGDWHLPFISEQDKHTQSIETQLIQSVARCARTSYTNFYGKNSLEEDKKLYNHLYSSGHWSPFEHQLQAVNNVNRCGNVRGYVQFRKTFLGEGEER